MEGEENNQSTTLLDVEEDGLVLPLDAEKEEVDEEKENVEAEKEEKTLRRKYHENIFFY